MGLVYGPLIIGYEESAEGQDALALGAQLADALEAPPMIALALTQPHGVLGAEEYTRGELIALLESRAARALAGPLEQLAGLGPTAEVELGSSAPRVLRDLAESNSAAAVVVGSSARGALGRLVPGSTAERLVQGAPCAVAVAARGYAEQGTRLRRIAVAVDGSTEAALALRAAVTVAKRCKSVLTLLAVVETVGFGPTPGAARTIPVAKDQAREEQDIRATLDAALRGVPRGLTADSRLLRGRPGEALATVSEDFDLIVVGSRGYGPLRRTLLGSTSRHLLYGSRVSVLVLPRGTGPEPFGDPGHRAEGEGLPGAAKEPV